MPISKEIHVPSRDERDIFEQAVKAMPPYHVIHLDVTAGRMRNQVKANLEHYTLILEKPEGTAKYANHAKTERIGSEDGFSQRVNLLVHSTPFLSAYAARL